VSVVIMSFSVPFAGLNCAKDVTGNTSPVKSCA
jgi:hypothetical protein